MNPPASASSTEPTLAARYDTIIVGGGSSGSILAARLSENPHRRVLLVEAGSLRAPEHSGRAADVINSPSFATLATMAGMPMWDYELSPDPIGPHRVIRGKGIGGSGAINGAYFVRNVPEDFDAWGSPLWSAEAVMPFFVEMEADADFSGEWHGSTGPIPVERMPRELWRPAHVAFHVGAQSLGLAEKPDINHPTGEGVGPMPRNSRNGLRTANDLTHLEAAIHRDNLTVLADTEVVAITSDDRVVTGVTLSASDGTRRNIEAAEVILCAGALESPRLLMRSGIGPAAALAEAGIEPVHVLDGVGQNLRDHPAVAVDFHPTTPQRERESSVSAAVTRVYSSTAGTERNDMQMFPHYAKTTEGTDVVRVACMLHTPRAVGELTLSPAPAHSAILTYNFLRHDDDVTRLVEAVRQAHLIMTHDDAREIMPCVSLVPPQVLDNDEAAATWVKEHVFTFFHTVGTCAMGRVDDPTAVVDERGRVHGIEGLRVADLSIVPLPLRGGNNPAAMMIAERMAALIEEEVAQAKNS